MKVKEKTIEEKYLSLSELDHVIMRSGMYIGSVKEEQKNMFIYDVDDAKIKLSEMSYTPGLLKLIDEVISNIADEYRRKDNMGLTHAELEFSRQGHFRIKDNGGIPVVKHKVADMYVPAFIFSTLRTSSNYDDSEERTGIGTNGLGCKICNIFSKYFSVYTADTKKSYFGSWSNNMKTKNDNEKVAKCSDHFTEFQFDIDWTRFEDVDYVTDDFAAILEKRIIDLCAANPGLVAHYKFTDGDDIIREVEWNFKSFNEYIELYSDYIDAENEITFKDKQKQVWIYPDGGLNVGFVNGAECSKGTHIKAIRSEINSAIAAHILQKNKLDVGPRNVDGKYTMFCVYHVANPSYNSQTKEELTTPVERFSMEADYKFNIPDKFIKECCKSEIVNIVIDWYKQKSEVEDQKTLRKLNKQAKCKVQNSEKFIDANTKVRKDKELWIFEGASAASGFRVSRFPATQAAYMLRGKILNVNGMSPTAIMKNPELSDIINIIGLQWGERNLAENLNFGKIVLAQDQDYDGFSISGLFLNFFMTCFPELIEQGMVCRSVSPIIIAKKGKEVKKYFRIEDYHSDESKLKGYRITYIKGLGSLETPDFKEMLQHPTFHYFTKDDMAEINIRAWYSKTEAKTRKEIMKNDVE